MFLVASTGKPTPAVTDTGELAAAVVVLTDQLGGLAAAAGHQPAGGEHRDRQGRAGGPPPSHRARTVALGRADRRGSRWAGRPARATKLPGAPATCILPRRRIRGAQHPRSGGPSSWGESRGESAGGAGSFSASPTANPAGRRKRILRVAHLILPSLAAFALAGASSASASSGGGGAAPRRPGRAPAARRRPARPARTGTGTTGTTSPGTTTGSSPAECRRRRRPPPRPPAARAWARPATRRVGRAALREPDRARHHGQDHPRRGLRAGRRAAPGAEGDLGRRPDPPEALPRRRRPRQVERHRLRLLRHRLLRAARRRTAEDLRGLGRDDELGQARARPLGHGLHQPRPRVRRDRRDPARHLGRGRPEPGSGHRAALAPGDDQHARVRGAASVGL